MTSKPPKKSLQGLHTVTVYAASSDALDSAYFDDAEAVGRALASAGLRIVYGGGGTGLMRAMADGALAAGGEVHGVTPGFLRDLEVSHEGLTSLTVVDDMRDRKHRMLEGSSAVVTLPGGCGTYEEVFEAMTLKRLGQWAGPIVMLNTRGFYDRLVEFLDHSVEERFMGRHHQGLWQVVASPDQVVPALHSAPDLAEDALAGATLRSDG